MNICTHPLPLHKLHSSKHVFNEVKLVTETCVLHLVFGPGVTYHIRNTTPLKVLNIESQVSPTNPNKKQETIHK